MKFTDSELHNRYINVAFDEKPNVMHYGQPAHSSEKVTDPARQSAFNRCSLCGDWFKPAVVTDMVLDVRYQDPKPCGDASKAVRLDGEIMPLLKAAPALLQALTNLEKMVTDGDVTTIELEEARAAIAAAQPKP